MASYRHILTWFKSCLMMVVAFVQESVLFQILVNAWVFFGCTAR